MDDRFATIPLRPDRRDIRPDLKDRLREASALRDEHMQKAEFYAEEVDLLTRMIERENGRYGDQSLSATKPNEGLAEFIESALKMRPMSKEDIRDVATRAGYSVDGRSIHATTVNLSRTGRIVEIEDGIFADPDSDLVKRRFLGAVRDSP